MHSGSATDSRLHHYWCEVVKKKKKKFEPGVLVALMLWLPRGLQLPLCPISVMDELRLISVAASPVSIYSRLYTSLFKTGMLHHYPNIARPLGLYWKVKLFFSPGRVTSEECGSQTVDVLFGVRWGKSGIDTALRFSRNIHQEPSAWESISLTQQSIRSINHYNEKMNRSKFQVRNTQSSRGK